METTGERSVALADTFPKLLLDHLRIGPLGRRFGKRFRNLAILDLGEYAAERGFLPAAGGQGFQAGRQTGHYRRQPAALYWTAAATQALGASRFPLYQDAVAEEMVFVIDNAEIRFVVVEDKSRWTSSWK